MSDIPDICQSPSICQTPILLLLFNRSDNASRLIASLRRVRPSLIYVNIDAPRENNNNDSLEVQLCKDIIESIDWKCTIYRQYHKRNLGCKLSVVSGINWFFQHCDHGIILEDDCIPSPSFFDFCSTMLAKYKNDLRIMQISGSNFVHNYQNYSSSYYYSAINDIWGWATWRRAWQHFSLDMSDLDQFLDNGVLDIYTGNAEISKWLRIYLLAARNPLCSTWSSQWTYAMLRNFGFTVVPPVNLVHNIGFRGGRGVHSNLSSFYIYDSFNAKECLHFPSPKFFYPDRYLDNIRFSLIKKSDPIFSLFPRLIRLVKSLLPPSAISFVRTFHK